jgi:hypothetical protein
VLDKGVTTAEIQNGATVTGGTSFTVSAIATQKIINVVKAGAAGGTAIAPAVGIVVALPETNAKVGTGAAITATGNVLIEASYGASIDATGDADSAGTSVAVGAIIAVNVLLVNTEGSLARNITGAGAIAVKSTSTVDIESEVHASAKGESKDQTAAANSDGQANNQVNGNRSTNGTTGSSSLPSSEHQVQNGNSQGSGQSGNSGGSTGVAAAIAFNWVEVTNTAKTANSLTLSGSGALLVGATHQADVAAKATGLAYNISTESSDALVAAAIGFNYVKVTSKGTIGDSSLITTAGVTAQALTSAGQRNDVVAWGLAAAGGQSDTNVAASVGINYVELNIEAKVGANSTITSTGVLGAQASAPLGLQNLW